MKMQKKKGFTVIEFIITLSVAAILLAIALPSFTTLAMNNRITSQTNDFMSSLTLARSEALKQVHRVTICKSAEGESCTDTGGWEQGWIVFADGDSIATVDGDDSVIRYYETLQGDNTLRGSTNVANYVSYVASGATRMAGDALQSGTLVLCDERGAGEHARQISINAAGRARVESTDPASCTFSDEGGGSEPAPLPPGNIY